MPPIQIPEIAILVTGGTFEKKYSVGLSVQNFSYPKHLKELAITDMKERFGLDKVTIEPHSMGLRDSMGIDDVYRNEIVKWCNTHPRSIVVHGTDTLLKTAAALAKNVTERVVVLTGALQPARMKDSDAEFNLGGAIIAAQTAGPGIWIVMNGHIFAHNKCGKNPQTGFFEPEVRPK